MPVIQVLLSEMRIAGELLTSLREQTLPEKYLYWFPLSARLWLDLCQGGAHEPKEYKNFSRSQQLILAHSLRVADLLSQHKELEVLSLGPGDGSKDLVLLEALREKGMALTYVPIDISQSFVEMACQKALAKEFDTYGYKADFSDAKQLEILKELGGKIPRLILMLGNTLGGYDPLTLLPQLKALMRRHDSLLVDGHLFSPDVLQEYDNPLNRRFALSPLRSLGVREDDGTLQFKCLEDQRRKGLYSISKEFIAKKDISFYMGDQEVPLKREGTLKMSPSYKYTKDLFLQLLRDVGKLSVEESFVSDDKKMMAVLATDVDQTSFKFRK